MHKTLSPQIPVLVLLLAAGVAANADVASNAKAERPDLLTFGRGTVFVSQSGLASGSASGALLAVNGDPYRMSLAVDRQLPVEFVFKLPAATTFDRFAVPNVIEQPGNVTFIKSVVVSGSLEGPDSGYQQLARFELEAHAPDEEVTEVIPEVQTPVRWIKMLFDGGINIEEGDEGKTNIWFSELIGNGTQESRELSTAFDGVWDFRNTERLEHKGIPLDLNQSGATITGCLGTIEINGTVNGAIARATGVDTRDGRPSAFIFVADEDGSIQGLWSRNRGRFTARTAVADPAVTSSPCSEAPPEPKACGASVYVNFDLDSAVIRPESDQVLSDLYDRLLAEEAQRVSIVGHTSTEGSVEHNLDLSERRAQAVVDNLIERGFAAANISATGEGESQPLVSPDTTETARELNRRVEISCSADNG
ncbi:MAG: OmpA family protein [Thermoanaerobaculia bacterium]